MLAVQEKIWNRKYQEKWRQWVATQNIIYNVWMLHTHLEQDVHMYTFAMQTLRQEAERLKQKIA